jgi:protein gp37
MPTTRETAPTWTDRTWNPVSPGLGLDEDRLNQPFRWKKSARVHVSAESDLFHPDIDDRALTRVFDVMEAGLNRRHTFQVLTAHPERMQSFMLARQEAKRRYAAQFNDCPTEAMRNSPAARDARARAERPPVNLWLGVPVRNQRAADARIPALLETPAAVRFVLCAPLLGPVELYDYLVERRDVTDPYADAPDGAVVEGMERSGDQWARVERLHWVVAGGETGPKARPLHPAWARSLRNECAAAGVPFFFTQHGEYVCAAVEDDPDYAGGRAYDNPLGGRSSATLRELGPSRTFRGGPTRLMRPGDRTRRAVMLDVDTIAVRVGRAAAGRALDGRTHDAFPEPSSGR